jgi:hypothetical protein
LIHYEDADDYTYLIKNDIQKVFESNLSEVKFLKSDNLYNPKLFLIDKEIHDSDSNSNEHKIDSDESIFSNELDISTYKRAFGNILHLYIDNKPYKSAIVYCEIHIYSVTNPSNQILIEKFPLSESQEFIYFTPQFDKYEIVIKMWDEYNNMELYEYEYNIDAEAVHIDFDIFSSIQISDEIFNPITSDIDAPSETLIAHSPDSIDYILRLRDIPNDLSLYYTKYISESVKYLSDNKRFNIKEINNNFKMGDITETIPLTYIDEWIEILGIPYVEGKDLYLRIYDVCTGEYIYIHYMDFNRIREYYGELLDCIYISKNEFIDIETKQTITEYMVFATELGISFSIDIFDFVLSTYDFDNCISIYDTTKIKITKKRIPVNYDFPIYPLTDDTYISAGYDKIKSIYPRLTNIKYTKQTIELEDIIVAKVDTRYIIDEKNITWTVSNTFTGEIIYQTNDYLLKYRVEDQIIYSITCEFIIGSKRFKLEKPSVLSNFKKAIFEISDDVNQRSYGVNNGENLEACGDDFHSVNERVNRVKPKLFNNQWKKKPLLTRKAEYNKIMSDKFNE